VAVSKSPGLASFLSLLLPGLGEIYAGQLLRSIPFLVADLYVTWLTYKDQSPTSLHLDFGLLFIGVLISLASMIDAAYCAIQYNRARLDICPNCGAKNVKGNPACLMCGTPLPGAVAPGPPPGSPPLR